MKKLLLSLAALATFAFAANAESTVLDNWTSYTWTGDAQGWTANVKGYTITTEKGSSNTDMVQPDQYSIRVYQGASITVTAPEGTTFDNVVVTLDKNTKGYSGVADGWTSTTGSTSDLKFTLTADTPQNSITFSGDNKQLRIASMTINAGGDESTDPGTGDGGNTGGGDNPGGDSGDTQEGVTIQNFVTGLGFPEGAQAAVPTEPTEVTASDTGITYELLGTNVNTGNYLMIAGKVVAGAYISFELPFDCETILLTTTGGCSTNAANAVNIYANGNVIASAMQVNEQNHTYTVTIPTEYQSAGTVYKVESNSDKYNTQFAKFAYYEIGAEVPENPDPETPETPEGVITVAEALTLISGGYNGTATVQGYITGISDMSNTDSGSTYGNATYTISDTKTGSNTLTVYRGYWMDGEKFATGKEIEVGGLVTVEGTILSYNGTPEFTSGSKVIAYTAPEGGSGDEPTEPEGDSVTFDFTQPDSLNPAQDTTGVTEIDLTDVTLYAGPISILSEAAEGASNKPRLFYSDSGTNPGWTYRFYKDNTITVSASGDYAITSVQFNGTNLANQSVVFSDNGTFSGTTWTANDEEGVTSFSITKTATGNNPTIKTMKVFYKESSMVEGVVVDENAPVEYYNLQGVRVNEPAQGTIVIRRQGTEVKKVIF